MVVISFEAYKRNGGSKPGFLRHTKRRKKKKGGFLFPLILGGLSSLAGSLFGGSGLHHRRRRRRKGGNFPLGSAPKTHILVTKDKWNGPYRAGAGRLGRGTRGGGPKRLGVGTRGGSLINNPFTRPFIKKIGRRFAHKNADVGIRAADAGFGQLAGKIGNTTVRNLVNDLYSANKSVLAPAVHEGIDRAFGGSGLYKSSRFGRSSAGIHNLVSRR